MSLHRLMFFLKSPSPLMMMLPHTHTISLGLASITFHEKRFMELSFRKDSLVVHLENERTRSDPVGAR